MGVSDMSSQNKAYTTFDDDATENTRYVSPMEAELKALGNTIDELSDAIDLLGTRLDAVRRPTEYLEKAGLEERDVEDRPSVILENVREKRDWVNRLIFQVRRMTNELDV